MVQDSIQLYDQNNSGTSQDQEEANIAKRNKEAEAAEDQDQEGRGRAGDGGESCTINAQEELLVPRGALYRGEWEWPYPLKKLPPPSKKNLVPPHGQIGPPLTNFFCGLRAQFISHCHIFSETRSYFEILIINLPHCVVNQTQNSSSLKICTLVIMPY